MRILVIEDEPSIARLVRLTLERDGHEVVIAATARAGLARQRDWAPDAIVLDLMLPDRSGLDLGREIREESDVPIVILTSRALESDRVAGLDLGADDYVVKPFSPAELSARLRAVTRRRVRRDVPAPRGALVHDDLRLDPAGRRATRGGEDIGVTNREYEILRMLMRRPGQLVSRDAISHALWSRTATDAKNLLDVHMSSLRKKLGDSASAPRYIQTVRGKGFRLLA